MNKHRQTRGIHWKGTRVSHKTKGQEMKPSSAKDRNQAEKPVTLVTTLYFCLSSWSQPVHGPQLPHLQFTRPHSTFQIKFQILKSVNLIVIYPSPLTVIKNSESHSSNVALRVPSWGHRKMGYQRKGRGLRKIPPNVPTTRIQVLLN